MARIKYYNTETGKWEYADSHSSVGNVDLSGVVKSVNGQTPDENGNVEIEVSGGNVDGKAIIDVVELPTENIREDVFYRLLTGNFVFNQYVQNMYMVHCVETLPKTGLPATNVDNTEGHVYYDVSNGEAWGYVDEILSYALAVPVGWYSVATLLGALGYDYSGVITNILDDPLDGAFRLLLEYVVYDYKAGNWTSHKKIGWPGTGLSAEVFNHPSNIASGEASHAEGSFTKASGAYSHVEGQSSVASGRFSHAEGFRTVAASDYQHVHGCSNVIDNARKYLQIVGNGSLTVGDDVFSRRSNAHTLDWGGNAWYQGDVYVHGTGQDDPEAVRLATMNDIPDQTFETVLSLKEVQVGNHKSGAFDSADNKSICTKGYVKPFVVSVKVVSADYQLAVVVYDNGAYVRTDSWITVDNTYAFDHEKYQYKLYIKRPDNDYIWDFDGCRKSIILTISTADILESYNALEVKSDTERRNTRNAVEYMMRRNYDISYANAPAPLDLITYAGNNQIVHPKVLYFPNKFGRHKFWLAYNPYPLANAYYENPCVAYSDDGYEWTNIPGNPLDEPGEYGINTDVHLVYVEAKNRLEIWWRYADNKDDTVEVRREIIYRRTSADGLNWSEKETVLVNDSGDTVRHLSPCILHDGSKYRVWVVNDTESIVKYYEGMEETEGIAAENIALNDADLLPGSLLVNGSIQESEDYKHTEKIKLSASKTFSLTGKNSNGVPYHIPIRYIVAYDANGNRLSDFSNKINTEGGSLSSMPTRPIVMNEAVDSVVLTLYRPDQYTEKVITLEGVDGGTSELSFVRDIPLTFPDDGTGHRLWHIDVIEDNGKTVMLPMCRARDSSVATEQTWSLFLCTSEDNVTYTEPVQTIVGNPYGWDKQIYRSSIVNVDGEYRIYYTAQDERQRHGLGVSTSNTLSNFVGKW